MKVRAVSNYQEFVKVRETRILLYCILIENMKYLLCLSSPPLRKQDFYWTYPKVLAISVHDASTSRATSEVIRIPVEIPWWAKIYKNLNTEALRKSIYNHHGENGKTLEKKNLCVFRYWMFLVFQPNTWKVFFSCFFECTRKKYMWKEQCKFWINAGCLCKTTRRVVSSILTSSSENFSDLSGVWILLLL